MNNQENRAGPDYSYRDPSFSLVKADVPLGDRIGIVENEQRSFKAYVVFAQILRVLELVPFKTHGQSP